MTSEDRIALRAVRKLRRYYRLRRWLPQRFVRRLKEFHRCGLCHTFRENCSSCPWKRFGWMGVCSCTVYAFTVFKVGPATLRRYPTPAWTDDSIARTSHWIRRLRDESK